MKLTKICALVLAACMAGAALAGCSDKPAESGSVSGGTSTGDKSEEEVVSMGGYHFTWMSCWPQSLYTEEEGQTDYADRLMARYEEVEEKYDCTIELVDCSVETIMDDINRAALAGERLADFIQLDYMRFYLVANGDTFRPLDTIEGFDVNMANYNKSVTEIFTKDDGHVYGVNSIMRTPNWGVIMMYNKTLLQNEKCEDPFTLYKEGNWTFDKFEEICKAITKKKDGKTVQWGFATADWGGNNCEKPFIFANGGSVIKKNAEDKWEFAMLDEPAQTALTFLNRIELQEGYFKPSRSDAYANLDTLTKDGTIGFFVDNPQIMIERAASNMEDDWGLVPLPKGPNATEHTVVCYQPNAFFMMSTVPEEDAQKAAYIFDKICRPLYGSAEDDQVAFYDEYATMYMDNDPDKIEVLKFASNPVVDKSWILPSPDTISNAIMSCVRSSSETPKAAMEKIAATVNSNIQLGFYGVVVEPAE